ncbi:MAG TPA: RNA polymerase sigma factor [Longimicrobiales bacterium]|nr:RNA polymerase sigma factor [Longimicrobiales bacterium]
MMRIREGDVRALQVLMDAHWVDIVRYASVLLGSEDDGEDVAQEVFVRVWQKRASWVESGSGAAYLYRIARNLVLGRLRKNRIRARSMSHVLPLRRAPWTPFDFVARHQLSEAFEGALQDLPLRRREAFELVRVQGLSLSEAAEIMEVTRRTVANHLYLAVLDLESSLRPFLPEASS